MRSSPARTQKANPIFNSGNMAGKKPGDADQTAENRGEPNEHKEKIRRLGGYRQAALAGPKRPLCLYCRAARVAVRAVAL